VLALAMASAFGFQFVLGALAPAFSAELGLSRTNLGVFSSAFYASGALTSSLLARRIATVRPRIGAFLLFGLPAAACLLAAAIATAPALVVAAVTAGAAAGLSNPVTNMAIAARGGRAGALVGVKQAGVQVGAMLAGIGVPVLALANGWRGALLWIGGALLLAGACATWGVAAGAAAADPRSRRPEQLPTAVAWLCGYAFFMGAGVAMFTTYLVLYGHDRLALSAGTAGALLAVFGATGAGARLAVSVLAERGEGLRRWLTLAGFVAAIGVAVFAATPSLPLVWTGVVLVGMSGAAWNCVAMLAVLRLSPPRRSAHPTGVVLTGFFVGLATAPPIFGATVDGARSYGPGWCLTGGCFLLAGALMVAMRRRGVAV
jgi:cyanate permease